MSANYDGIRYAFEHGSVGNRHINATLTRKCKLWDANPCRLERESKLSFFLLLLLLFCYYYYYYYYHYQYHYYSSSSFGVCFTRDHCELGRLSKSLPRDVRGISVRDFFTGLVPTNSKLESRRLPNLKYWMVPDH